MRLFYYTGSTVVKAALLCLSRWQVHGTGQTPKSGSLIIVSNHISFIDPPLLTASIRRRILFMAKREYFHSIFPRAFMLGIDAFPVHRGRLDREALRQAERVLQRGLALGMFPEGTRSATAQLQHGYPGVPLIALRCGAPILPVGITGAEKVKSISDVLSRPQITVNIGSPFYLPASEGRLTSARLAKLTDLIMEHIAQLLPASYRGAYRETGEGTFGVERLSQIGTG